MILEISYEQKMKYFDSGLKSSIVILAIILCLVPASGQKVKTPKQPSN
jgi:hypothetical protein